MQTRELGNSGLDVSALGFGCMGIRFSYAIMDDDSDVASPWCVGYPTLHSGNDQALAPHP